MKIPKSKDCGRGAHPNTSIIGLPNFKGETPGLWNKCSKPKNSPHYLYCTDEKYRHCNGDTYECQEKEWVPTKSKPLNPNSNQNPTYWGYDVWNGNVCYVDLKTIENGVYILERRLWMAIKTENKEKMDEWKLALEERIRKMKKDYGNQEGVIFFFS